MCGRSSNLVDRLDLTFTPTKLYFEILAAKTSKSLPYLKDLFRKMKKRKE